MANFDGHESEYEAQQKETIHHSSLECHWNKCTLQCKINFNWKLNSEYSCTRGNRGPRGNRGNHGTRGTPGTRGTSGSVQFIIKSINHIWFSKDLRRWVATLITCKGVTNLDIQQKNRLWVTENILTIRGWTSQVNTGGETKSGWNCHKFD